MHNFTELLYGKKRMKAYMWSAVILFIHAAFPPYFKRVIKIRVPHLFKSLKKISKYNLWLQYRDLGKNLKTNPPKVISYLISEVKDL